MNKLIETFKSNIFYSFTPDYPKVYFDYYKYKNKKMPSKYKNQIILTQIRVYTKKINKT